MNIRAMRKVVLFVAVVTLSTAFVLSAINSPWVTERVRIALVTLAGKAVKTDVVIKGISFGLFPPSVEARDVSVRDLLDIRRAKVTLSPLQLFVGKITIQEVALEGLRGRLSVLGGKPQLPFTLPKARKPSKGPVTILSSLSVSSIKVTQGEIGVALDRPDLAVLVSDISAEVRPDLKAGRFPFSFSTGKTLVTYQKKRLPPMTFTGLGVARGEELSLKSLAVGIPGAAITLTGTIVGFHQSHVDIRVAGGCDLERAGDILAEWIPRIPDLKGQASWDITVTGTPPEANAHGRISLTGGRIGKFAPEDIEAVFTADRKSVEFSQVTVKNAGGTVTVRGSIDLTGDMRTRADVVVSGVSFARLLNNLSVTGSRVDSTVSVRASLSGTLTGDPGLFLDGDAEVLFKDFAVTKENYLVTEGNEDILRVRGARVNTRVTIDRDMVRISPASVDTGTSLIQADAELRYKNTFSVSFTSDALDISSLSPIGRVPFAGKGRVFGTISGPYVNPEIVGDADLPSFGLFGWDFGATRGTIRYHALHLYFPDVRVERGKSRFLCSGEIAFVHPVGLTLKVAVPHGGRLEDIVGVWARGYEDRIVLKGEAEGEVRLDGPVMALSGEGRITLSDAGVLGETFSRGSAWGRMEQGGLVVEDITLYKETGMISIRGSLSRDGLLSARLDSRGLTLDGINNLRKSHYPITGAIGLTTDLSGTFRNPEGSGSITLTDVKIADVKKGDSLFALALKDGVLFVRGKALGEEAAVDSSIDFQNNARYDAVLRLTDMDLSPVLMALYTRETRLRGRVGGGLRLHGSLKEGHELHEGSADLGSLEIREATPQAGGFALTNDGPIRFKWGDGTLDFGSFAMRETGNDTGEVRLTGAAGKKTVDLTAKGSLDLRPLALFFPTFVQLSEGRLAFDISAHGTRPSLQFDGTLSLNDGSILFTWLPARLTGLNVAGSMNGDTLRIASASGRLGNGRLSGKGRITFSGFSPAAYDLSAALKDLDITFARGVSALFDGSLALQGPASSPAVAGDIVVREARLTRWIDWEALVMEGLLKQYMGGLGANEEGGVRLAVKVSADGGIMVRNNLAQGELKGRGIVGGTVHAPAFHGGFEFVKGSIYYLDNRFDITTGMIAFSDEKEPVPTIDVSAVTVKRRVKDMRSARGEVKDVKDYRILLHALGRPDDLKITLASEPADLSESEMYSVLAMGTIGGEELGGEALGMATAYEFGRVIGTKLVEKIGSTAIGEEETEKVGGFFRRFAVDTIQLSPSSVSGTPYPRITVGKSWGDKWEGSMSTETGGKGGGRVELKYTVNRRLSLLGNWDNDSAILMGDPDPLGNLGADVVFTLRFR